MEGAKPPLPAPRPRVTRTHATSSFFFLLDDALVLRVFLALRAGEAAAAAPRRLRDEAEVDERGMLGKSSKMSGGDDPNDFF